MTVDELETYGMVEMEDDEIRGFLSSQRIGTLALPTDGAPSMRPLSYGYEGGDALYLCYVGGAESRKATLTDASETARFLVYSAETVFNWRSVLLTGRLVEVDGDEAAGVDIPWQPDLFRRASESERTRIYRFDITDRNGIKHVGLPPAFERDGRDERDETA